MPISPQALNKPASRIRFADLCNRLAPVRGAGQPSSCCDQEASYFFSLHEQCRRLSKGLLLARGLLPLLRRSLRLEGFDLPLVLAEELLKFLPLGHGEQPLGVGILDGLPPLGHLLRKQQPLPAVGAGFPGIQGSRLKHLREVVGGAPAFWFLFRCVH